jgi:hypothetical protein
MSTHISCAYIHTHARQKRMCKHKHMHTHTHSLCVHTRNKPVFNFHVCVCVVCVCVCVCVSLCVCRFVCVCICAIQPYSIQYTHHIMCKRLSSLNRSRAFASFTTKYTPHTEGGTQTPPHTHTHTQTLTGAKEGRNRSGVPLPGLPFILLLVHGDFRRQGPRGRRAKARDVLHP